MLQIISVGLLLFQEYVSALPPLRTGDQLQPRSGHRSRCRDRPHRVRDPHERRPNSGVRGRRRQPHQPEGHSPLQRLQGGPENARVPPPRSWKPRHHLLGTPQQDWERGQRKSVQADPEGHGVQQTVLFHHRSQQDAQI